MLRILPTAKAGTSGIVRGQSRLDDPRNATDALLTDEAIELTNPFRTHDRESLSAIATAVTAPGKSGAKTE